jgi:DNA-binding NarL/FixJ family response regulator
VGSVSDYASPAVTAGSLRLRERESALDAIQCAVRGGAGAVVVGPAASGRTRLLAELRRSAGTGILPVADHRLIDDAEYLAPAEIDALVGDRAPLVVAVRVDARPQLEAALRAWRAHGLVPVVLDPLGTEASKSIVSELLGDGTLDPSVDALWSLGGGRPGDLVELTLGSLEVGSLAHRDGRWRLVGEVAVHRIVTDLWPRLGSLLGAAELVAVGEPLPVQVASRVLGRRRHEALHRAGVLTVLASDHVMFARPAEAAQLRAECPSDRRLVHLRALAEAADGVAQVPVERVAAWWLEVGGGDPRLLREAAASAHGRGAFGLAARFASASLRRAPHGEAALARGIARANLGDPDGARRDLERVSLAEADAAPDRSVIEVALAHALRAEDPEGASAQAVRAGGDLGVAYVAVREAVRGQVSSARALVAGLGTGAEDRGRALPGETGRLAAFASAVADAIALDSAGRGASDDGASAHDATAHRWTDPDASSFDVLPLGRDAVDAARVELEVSIGDALKDLRARAEERLVRAERTGSLIGRFAWSAVLGSVWFESGDLDRAHAELRAAGQLADEIRFDDAAPVLQAHRAWVAAQSGASAHARRLIARVPDDGNLRASARVDLAAACASLVDAPDARDARRALNDVLVVGDAAAADGQLDVAAQAYALPVRVDAANGPALDRLRSLAQRITAPMATSLVAHAEALIADDVAGLVEASDGYLASGRRLRAAEAIAQAARRSPAHARLTARAGGVLASCTGAWSPLLAELAPFELRPRAREIGRLTVDGWSNSQVADRLSISVRTVESALTDLYRSLGVGDRRELARVHGPLFAAG